MGGAVNIKYGNIENGNIEKNLTSRRDIENGNIKFNIKFLNGNIKNKLSNLVL